MTVANVGKDQKAPDRPSMMLDWMESRLFVVERR